MSRLGPIAPGDVALRSRLTIDQLLWVANTRHGPGGHWFARVHADAGDHDHLRDADDAVAYLTAHRVPLPELRPTAGQLARLASIRESVRALTEPAAPPLSPAARTLVASARFRIEPDGTLRSSADGWHGFMADLVPPLLQLLELRDRLRVCGNPYCRLIFVDLSRNRRRRWCDSAGCGNRDRVARHRRTAQRTATRSSEASPARRRPGRGPEGPPAD